jgi:hypothetical protein
VRLAGAAHRGTPADYKAAIQALEHRGMLRRSGPVRTRTATSQARLAARQERVLALVRQPAAPVGEDAELLVLLAAAQALAVPGPADHMRAHLRIRSIGQKEAVPSAVSLLAASLGAGSMAELADRLLPAQRGLADAKFDTRSSVGF